MLLVCVSQLETLQFSLKFLSMGSEVLDISSYDVFLNLSPVLAVQDQGLLKSLYLIFCPGPVVQVAVSNSDIAWPLVGLWNLSLDGQLFFTNVGIFCVKLGILLGGINVLVDHFWNGVLLLDRLDVGMHIHNALDMGYFCGSKPRLLVV